VRGVLNVIDAGNVGAGVVADGGIKVSAFTVADPCECGPSQLIDVAGIVAHGVVNNDNGGACNPPPDAGTLPDGGFAPDAGSPACGTCSDCNNQACVAGRCGACTTDSQCCAPLICQAGYCLPQIN
jgi:hypothetical protein